MIRRSLAILALAINALGVASAQPIPPDEPAIYLAQVNGALGWDVMPGTISTLFADADRQFSDLIDVPSQTSRSPSRVVEPEAWANHVIVLKLNLTSDDHENAIPPTRLFRDIRKHLKDQAELRNRRVALWVENATDASWLLVTAVPEVFVTPDASATVSDSLAKWYAATNDGAAVPTTDDFPLAADEEELLAALALPDDTRILGDSGEDMLRQWKGFRDRAIEKATHALGPRWDVYIKVRDNPAYDASEIKNARRQMKLEVSRAQAYIARFDELSEHPVFAELRKDIVEKLRILQEDERNAR